MVRTKRGEVDEELDDFEQDLEDDFEQEDCEEDEQEQWEQDERTPSAARGAPAAHIDPVRAAPRRGGLSLGFLALLPMLGIYEIGLAHSHAGLRNTSELVLFQVFAPLADFADRARWASLLAGSITALVICFKRRVPLLPGLMRIVFEGFIGALLIGPVLVGIFRLMGSTPPPSGLEDPGGPELSSAALYFGGGAYEELLFRVLLYGLVFLLARRVAFFFGASAFGARWGAELAGLCGSSLAFASFHLGFLTSWMGRGGESFDAGIFAWRLSAGVLLGLLFRWRGPGVAAWTHGLFNLALFLGAGPDVLL